MILLHYGPVVFLYLYCPLLYIGIVVLYKCKPVYDVNLYICGGPCYSLELGLGLFDWVGNGISMEMATLIVNVIVTIRHFIQRYRMKRTVLTADGRRQWNRSVKLGAQLIAIGMIYVIGWVPYSLIVLIQMFKGFEELADILSRVLAYFPYFQELILPFVAILYMPEIKGKLIAFCMFPCMNIKRRHQNQVQVIHNQTTITNFQSRIVNRR
ncbi:unnamed protein product [Rotaria sp. Silwood2]|nr:unnamed protein product [Rotaria sp. Silwood2]